jgi:hypothetical protein
MKQRSIEIEMNFVADHEDSWCRIFELLQKLLDEDNKKTNEQRNVPKTVD